MVTHSIDLQTFAEKEIKVQNKCYSVDVGDGFCFTNGMQYSELSIKYVNGKTICSAMESDSAVSFYRDFIQNIGAYSRSTQKNFTQNKFIQNDKSVADKYSLFTSIPSDKSKEVAGRLRSCRLREDLYVEIDGKKYFPATNLNISEFLHSISMRIPENEKKIFILIVNTKDGPDIFKEESAIISDNELEAFSKLDDCSFSVNLVEQNDIKRKDRKKNAELKRIGKIDFESLNKKKQVVGSLGEIIASSYLKDKYDKVEIVSDDSSLGYDIRCTDSEGHIYFVEVKTTRSPDPYGFYITQNEKNTAEQNKGNYFIYRLFNLNINKKTADLRIISNISEDDSLSFEPSCYLVKAKKR